MKRLFSPLRIVGAVAVLLVIAAIVLWIAPSGQYILLPDTAKPVAPLVTVGGKHKPAHDSGGIYFLAVLVRKATLLERLFPGIHDGATLVPASELRPQGVSEQAQKTIDEREMVRSQDIAGAVALRALGYHIEIKRTGARIAATFSGMPAARALRATEVIVSLDGKAVRGPVELRHRMSTVRPGQVVRLGIRNDRKLRTVRLRTVADPRNKDRALIGVEVDQAGSVHLPFPVRIDPGSVVGPSAGLAFALELMEKLGRDVDRGYTIAATGELELNGGLVPIGGVEQKAIEAKNAHVDILLVPAGDNAAVARKYAGSVRVVSVESFQQALRKLATLPPKG